MIQCFRKFVESVAGRLRLFFLPPYSPELNPDELVWNDLKKEGPSFDLPIALGIVIMQGNLNPEIIKDALIIGELSLDGSVRPIKGAVSMAVAAKLAANGVFVFALPRLGVNPFLGLALSTSVAAWTKRGAASAVDLLARQQQHQQGADHRRPHHEAQEHVARVHPQLHPRHRIT